MVKNQQKNKINWEKEVKKDEKSEIKNKIRIVLSVPSQAV